MIKKAEGRSPGSLERSRELLNNESTFDNITLRAAQDRPANENQLRGL